MKKIALIVAAAAALAWGTSCTVRHSAKTVQSNKNIPADVLTVIEGSCIDCHVEPGKKLALAFVNLSEWSGYSSRKQATKSKAMCRMVSKGKMPPKAYRKKNADFVLTKDDIKTICDWSASVQAAIPAHP
jgi:mono/diheme cytochrome c family protein